jgi:hypothetical protein
MENVIHEYYPDGYKKSTKLYLCAFCKSLFTEASQGALNIIRMKEDDDWD